MHGKLLAGIASVLPQHATLAISLSAATRLLLHTLQCHQLGFQGERPG